MLRPRYAWVPDQTNICFFLFFLEERRKANCLWNYFILYYVYIGWERGYQKFPVASCVPDWQTCMGVSPWPFWRGALWGCQLELTLSIMIGSRSLLVPLVRDRVQQGIDKVHTSGIFSLSHFQKQKQTEARLEFFKISFPKLVFQN